MCLGHFIADTRNRDEKLRSPYTLTQDDYSTIAELKLHMKKFDDESRVSHSNECIRENFSANREYWDTQDLSLFSHEHRQNMSKAWENRPPVSLETRRKKSESMKGKNVGKKQSPETIQKRSDSLKNKKRKSKES